MKKAIVVLSVVAFIAGGCGQKTDKQAAAKANGADSSVSNEGSAVETPDGVNADADRWKNFDSTLVGHDKEYAGNDTVTANDWKSVSCKWLNLDDGYTTRQECVFPGAKLQQVYDIVKKVDPNLKIELPAANIEYLCGSTNSGCKRVGYQYKSSKQLLIELAYNGGVTTVEVIEGKDNTQAKITYFAD